MSLWAKFAYPFSSARVGSSEVPGLFPCAINGRPYMIDTVPTEGYGRYRLRREPQPILRQQSDSSDEPGEHSVALEQHWRRSEESWHLGAGQSVFDRKTSTPYRYRTSKGVDPWTQWQLSLLNDTNVVLASANTNVRAVTVGAYVYVTDGQTVKRATGNLSSWTTLTAGPAATATSIATDGFNVWVAFGASGLYATTTAGTALSSFITGSVSLVGYANGRLIADDGAGKLYNITGASGTAITAQTLLLDRSGAAWSWSAIGSGQQVLYAGGSAGDKSSIYKTTISADASALAVPTVAVDLPDGEKVTALDAYLGFVLVGTTLGMRLASPQSDGTLTLGALIPTGAAVNCFEGQDRFAWFGWTNVDGVSTGLGRADLRNFPEAGKFAPAYASDLMATTQGATLSVCTFGVLRVFTVAGHGVYAELAATPVSSGQLSTGRITFGLGDKKVAVSVDLRFQPMPAGAFVAVEMATDGGVFVPLGNTTSGDGVSSTSRANQARGEVYEVRLTLTSYAAQSPVLTRSLLQARITPALRPSVWTVPLLISAEETVGGVVRAFDVNAELAFLNDLFVSGNVVAWQFGRRVYQVLLNNFIEMPEILPSNGFEPSRTLCVVELYEIAS